MGESHCVDRRLSQHILKEHGSEVLPNEESRTQSRSLVADRRKEGQNERREKSSISMSVKSTPERWRYAWVQRSHQPGHSGHHSEEGSGDHRADRGHRVGDQLQAPGALQLRCGRHRDQPDVLPLRHCRRAGKRSGRLCQVPSDSPCRSWRYCEGRPVYSECFIFCLLHLQGIVGNQGYLYITTFVSPILFNPLSRILVYLSIRNCICASPVYF